MIFKRLLVLNTDVSGMNRFLFHSLRQEGWELAVFDIPLPRFAVFWAYFSTFNLNWKLWKKRAAAKLGTYLKSPRIFRQRTAYCEKLLRKKWRRGDLILQIAGLFAPASNRERLPGPYAVFLSFTTKLAVREYPPWAPFSSEAAREAWYDLETQLYQKAALILTTNAHAKNSLVADYQVKGKAVSVIGYGINLDKTTAGKNSHSPNKILFIGYDFKRKGGPTVVAAFSLVKRMLPDAELIIVGPPRPDVVDSGINWEGPIRERERVSSLLQEASIFVMPSVCEPFGLVFLEAMSYGLPCIGSRRDAMPEIILEGETGYLVEPGDVEDLATKIELVLSDDKLRRRLGEAAAARVHQHFTWSLVGQRITAAVRNLERG